MPTSRGRSSSNRSNTTKRRERARRYRESRRQLAAPDTARQVTGRLGGSGLAAMRATADAEARGEVEEALRLYSQIDFFEGNSHGALLAQLAELGDDAPGWVWSRWATLQCLRPLWSDNPRANGPDPTLVRAVEVAYPHGVDTDRMDGMSMGTFVALLRQRDWVMRQLVVYEEGGLRDFVRHRAGERLLARADQVEAWPHSPMGGFRLESDLGGSLQLTDLATGDRIDVLDLGLAFQHWPGQHFLGRLVPTVAAPGLMFEWRPLPVDAVTADLVARAPEDWVDIVARRARTEDLPRMFSLLDDDCDLVTDLPAYPWMALLEPSDVGQLPQVEGVISQDDVALFVLARLLRSAGTVGPQIAVARHVIWSVLLQPGLDEAVREELTEPEHARAWRILAGVVPEPARGRCRRYAELAAGDGDSAA